MESMKADELQYCLSQNWAQLQPVGRWEEYLGIPFGLRVNLAPIDEELNFLLFLSSTLKYSRYEDIDEWVQAELEEERELITVRGNGSEYKAEARRRALVRDYSEAWMKAKNTCWSDDYHLGWSSKMLEEGIKKLEG